MLTSYQLDITDFYNTPIGHVKKLVPNFFLIKKGMCFIMKTLFKVRIKTTKKNTARIRIQSITMVKIIC